MISKVLDVKLLIIYLSEYANSLTNTHFSFHENVHTKVIPGISMKTDKEKFV